MSCKEDGIPNKIKYRGVVFYDDFTNLEMVAMVPKDRDDIIDIKPLSSTQVEEALLFRYLNDMRTRGTDIKLPLMTKGILTIGKDLCLSKLVQAAYRLRQLGKGQTLEFWLLDETFDSIRKFIETYGNRTNISDSSISSQDIYEWCASNSIKQAITF